MFQSKQNEDPGVSDLLSLDILLLGSQCNPEYYSKMKPGKQKAGALLCLLRRFRIAHVTSSVWSVQWSLRWT